MGNVEDSYSVPDGRALGYYSLEPDRKVEACIIYNISVASVKLENLGLSSHSGSKISVWSWVLKEDWSRPEAFPASRSTLTWRARSSRFQSRSPASFHTWGSIPRCAGLSRWGFPAQSQCREARHTWNIVFSEARSGPGNGQFRSPGIKTQPRPFSIVDALGKQGL